MYINVAAYFKNTLQLHKLSTTDYPCLHVGTQMIEKLAPACQNHCTCVAEVVGFVVCLSFFFVVPSSLSIHTLNVWAMKMCHYHTLIALMCLLPLSCHLTPGRVPEREPGGCQNQPMGPMVCSMDGGWWRYIQWANDTVTN